MKHSEICIKCGRCRFDLGPARMRAQYDMSKLRTYRFVHTDVCYSPGFHPCSDVTFDVQFRPSYMSEQLRLFNADDDVEQLFKGEPSGVCPHIDEHREAGL